MNRYIVAAAVFLFVVVYRAESVTLGLSYQGEPWLS